MTIALSILGASGKMGKRVLQLAEQDPQFRIVVGLTRSGLGDLPIPLSADPQAAVAECDVAIDFSSHEAVKCHLDAAINAKKALVIGTTGHTEEERQAIAEASKIIPILFSPNFSFGVALCLEAVARFSKALYGTCMIDITETHHLQKKDRPSGTALAFAQAIGNGKVVFGNENTQPHKKEEIVIRSIRTGEVIGEHLITFECGHERIELKHAAHSRDTFAAGALMGAKFLAKQGPGLYSLKDLFISEK